MKKRKSRNIDSVDQKEFIRAHKALKKKIKRKPPPKEYIAQCYGKGIIAKVFGEKGWLKLVRPANKKPRAHKTNTRFKLTAEHLFDDFYSLQHELGRRPKLGEYIDKRRYLPHVAVHYFLHGR